MAFHGFDKQFFRLVKGQRKSKDSSLQFICASGKEAESLNEICKVWATHLTPLRPQWKMKKLMMS